MSAVYLSSQSCLPSKSYSRQNHDGCSICSQRIYGIFIDDVMAFLVNIEMTNAE